MTHRARRGEERLAVLTVAGSDSGGGAGIQADLKVFAALGTHGTCAITCVTAQNPERVRGVTPLPAAAVVQQIETVWEAFAPAAVKTGMLYSRALIEAVAAVLRERRARVIVDPVAVSTSGAALLQPAAVVALQRKLLPIALLATPNLDETLLLTGVTVREPEDLRTAARVLHEQYGCAALIKGGHLEGDEAVDLLWDGHHEWLLSARRVKGVSSHGTGCTYSAATAAHLALGCDLPTAVTRGKEEVTQALAASRRVAGYDVLEPLWRRTASRA